MRKKVEALFGQWKAEGPAPQRANYGTVQGRQGTRLGGQQIRRDRNHLPDRRPRHRAQ